MNEVVESIRSKKKSPWITGISRNAKAHLHKMTETTVLAEFLYFSGNFPFLGTDEYTSVALRCGIRDVLEIDGVSVYDLKKYQTKELLAGPS